MPRTIVRHVYRRDLPHLDNGPRAIFVTMCTDLRWVLPPVARDIVLEHAIYEHRRTAFFYAVVVMPDHCHFLFAPTATPTGDSHSLAEIVDVLRGPSAHAVNKALHRHGKVWQRDFFDRLLRDAEFERYMSYICENPVRKGIVKESNDYRWLWMPDIY